MERRYGQVEGKEKIRYGLTVSQGIQALSREKKQARISHRGYSEEERENRNQKMDSRFLILQCNLRLNAVKYRFIGLFAFRFRGGEVSPEVISPTLFVYHPFSFPNIPCSMELW